MTDDDLETIKAERDDLEQLFELRHKADMRAVDRWRKAHPGNELRMPDHADLVVWLMDELAKLTRKAVKE
jgi:hypothetical protein